MTQVIKTEKLIKCFNDKTVLKGIDINVGKQEVFGLLGPSGAGKTTIIKILTGQLKPDRGGASIFDRDCANLDNYIYQNIGVVFEESGLYQRLSCYDNLCIFARIFKLEKARILEVLQSVGLENDAFKAANKLSKGMMQRLVFARAILNKPKLLFLDEPTSGLDPSTALEIHKLILSLRQNGTTVFLTTHNMEEATKLCDNVALLNEGSIIEYGSPKDICLKYNKEKKITVLTKSRQEYNYPCQKESADKIIKHLLSDEIESIHSSEPNLETVFISLTGRGFE